MTKPSEAAQCIAVIPLRSVALFKPLIYTRHGLQQATRTYQALTHQEGVQSKSSRVLKKTRQHRSRIAQRLNVRRRVRFASLLTAASLDGLFEHPAGTSIGTAASSTFPTERVQNGF